MSAQFLAAKAQKTETSTETAPEVMPMSPEEKASWDKILGDNQPDELTADALKDAQKLSRGEIPASKPVAKKTGGDVAAEPGSDTQKTAEKLAAEEAAKETKSAEELAAEEELEQAAEELAAEEAAKSGKTEEELAAEAEAAKEGKTEEELAAEAKTAEDKEAAEEADEARLAALEDDGKTKVRVRINRENFSSDEDFKIAKKAAALSNEFGLLPTAAEAEARRLLGLKSASAATETTIEIPETKDLEAAETEFTAARAAFRTARQNFDSDEMDKAEDAMETARTKRDKAAKAVETAQAAASVYQEAVDKAVEQYPGSDDPASPMGIAIAGIFASTPASDPFWKNPNRPMLAAEKAAKMLGLKSKTAATSLPVPPAKPAPTKQPKVSPVPAKARTLTPTAPPAAKEDADFAKVLGKNAHMLKALAKA